MTHPVAVTDGTFQTEVLEAETPVLVDFWAEWCQPCKMIAPHLEKIATEQDGKIKVAKLNVDENPATAARFGLRSIPTLLVLKGGREIDRIIGVQPKREILRRLKSLVA